MEMTRPVKSIVLPSVLSIVAEPATETEFTKYFAEVPSEPFVTTLSIPLAPTSIRAPLEPSFDSNTYSQVLSIHHSFNQHSIRVISLFRRLDRANVWDRGATVDCLDTVGDGLCRMLNVRMDGWSEETLKGVIGEAGNGWCRITSVRKAPVQSTAGSDVSLSPPSTINQMDFIMPTLDFSSSFFALPLPQCNEPHVIAESSAPSVFEEVGANEGSVGYLTAESDWESMGESALSAEILSNPPSGAASDVGDILDDIWILDSPRLESSINLSSSFNSRFF